MHDFHAEALSSKPPGLPKHHRIYTPPIAITWNVWMLTSSASPGEIITMVNSFPIVGMCPLKGVRCPWLIIFVVFTWSNGAYCTSFPELSCKNIKIDYGSLRGQSCPAGSWRWWSKHECSSSCLCGQSRSECGVCEAQWRQWLCLLPPPHWPQKMSWSLLILEPDWRPEKNRGEKPWQNTDGLSFHHSETTLSNIFINRAFMVSSFHWYREAHIALTNILLYCNSVTFFFILPFLSTTLKRSLKTYSIILSMLDTEVSYQ